MFNKNHKITVYWRSGVKLPRLVNNGTGRSHPMGSYCRNMWPRVHILDDTWRAPATGWTLYVPSVRNRCQSHNCQMCKAVTAPNRTDWSLNYVTGNTNTANFFNLNLSSVHVVTRLGVTQSRSLQTGNSHGLEIKLRSWCVEPVHIIGKTCPPAFYRDVWNVCLLFFFVSTMLVGLLMEPVTGLWMTYVSFKLTASISVIQHDLEVWIMFGFWEMSVLFMNQGVKYVEYAVNINNNKSNNLCVSLYCHFLLVTWL